MMYLHKDQYLNEYKRDFKNDKELYAFLQESFPSLVITPVKGSYLSSEICMLAYLCYCFSPYEAAVFLGNFFSGASVRTRVAELKSKNKGTLTSLRFSHCDMGAQKAFSISRQGYLSHLSGLPDMLKPAKGQIMVRRSGGLVPAHDYGTGISLLSFLTIGIPFYYEKEEVYSQNSIYKQRGSICVDCTLYLPTMDNYKVYIEQDMGTETTQTLVNKLASYKHLGLVDSNSCIVFSSHAIMDYSSCCSFLIQNLEHIYGDMIHNDINGVYDYYTSHGSRLDEKTLTVLKALLVRTNVCLAYADTNSKAQGANQAPEEVTASSILQRNVEITYIMKIDTGHSPTADFTVRELRKYIDDLRAGSNPYRVRVYNQEQDRIAKHKFHNMCSMLCRFIDRGMYNRDELLCLLHGYSCYMVPSVLLSNASRFFLPNSSLLERYERILLPYYPLLATATYSEWANPIAYEEYAPVRMRHAYTLENGQVVILEHIGKDIGAFVRCYYLRQLASLFPDMDIHVICICDTDADMIRFCEMADYTIKYSRFPERRGFYMSFLIETELQDDYGLLKGIDELGNPPIYIRTKKQSKALAEYLKGQRSELYTLPPVNNDATWQQDSISKHEDLEIHTRQQPYETCSDASAQAIDTSCGTSTHKKDLSLDLATLFGSSK